MQTDCFQDAIADWLKSPISVLAKINPRYSVKSGSELPFIEMASVAENFAGIIRVEMRKMTGSGLSRFKVGDTLFAKITPCPENGKVAFVRELPAEVGIGSTEFIVLSPRQGCIPRFLYHLLCCHEVRGRAVARMEGSTGRQRIPEDVFVRRLMVPIPPPEEQFTIAHVLDAVDSVLESTRGAVDSAKVLRRSLLASLLNRGIGSDGRARSPEHSPDQFVQTQLGELPRAWALSTVGNECGLQNGFTLNEARRPRFHKRRYLRVANVQRDALDLGDVQELEAGDMEFAPRVLQVDDLLVVEGHADRMQIGRCARVTEDAAGMTFQNHLFRLRTHGKVAASFACLWLNSAYALRYWNARCATSSGLNTINQRMLRRMVIPIPPKREQEMIVHVISQQRQHLEALVTKQHKLEALKRALMHDLFTGAVRVHPYHPEGGIQQ